MSSSYSRQLSSFVRQYRLAGGAWPARAIDIAEWVLGRGRWDVSRESKRRLLAEEIARAMAEETITNSEGLRVRLKHVTRTRINGEQGFFWDDIRTISEKNMRISAANRRNGILAECYQLRNDVRFFNELHPELSRPIQMSFDFTRDIQELDEGRQDDQAA